MAFLPQANPANAMYAAAGTPGTVLCCMCGANIAPNPANMCANCIRSQARRALAARRSGGPGPWPCRARCAERRAARQVDITEGIQKQCTVLWCKECNRWLNVRVAARSRPGA